MLAQLLDRTTRGARLAALIAVALVAGFGVATAVGAPGPTRLVTVVAGDQSASSNRHRRGHRERRSPRRPGSPRRRASRRRRTAREVRRGGDAGADRPAEHTAPASRRSPRTPARWAARTTTTAGRCRARLTPARTRRRPRPAADAARARRSDRAGRAAGRPRPCRAATGSGPGPAPPRRAPGAGRRPTARRATALALSSPATTAHTSREPWITAKPSEIRVGGGLGALRTASDRRVVVQRRVLGEQRGDVPVRADAQQADVERRCRAVVLRPRRPGQLGGVPRGRRLRVVTVRAVAGRHRVHPRRGPPAPRRATPRGPGSRCAPGRRPAGTARRPTTRPARRQSTAPRAGEAATASRVERAMRPARQHQRRRAPGRLDVGQPGDQPGSHRGRRARPGRGARGRSGRSSRRTSSSRSRPSGSGPWTRCASWWPTSSRTWSRRLRSPPSCVAGLVAARLRRLRRASWRLWPAWPAAARRAGSRQIRVRIGGRSSRPFSPGRRPTAPPRRAGRRPGGAAPRRAGHRARAASAAAAGPSCRCATAWPGSRPAGRCAAGSCPAKRSSTAVMPGPAESTRLTRTPSRDGQPAGEQRGARVPGSACTAAGRDLLVHVVERRGEQRPPRRGPGPGQVGVAGRVVLGPPLAARPSASSRRSRVGDPAVGEHAERVVGELLRRRAVPPGDHRRVRGEQRQHDRLGVQREPAVHPHHHRLVRRRAGRRPAPRRPAGRRRVDPAAHDDEQPAGVRGRGRGRRASAPPRRRSSSATTTRVSARPEASAPAARRSAASVLTISVPLVSQSVVTELPLRSGDHGPAVQTRPSRASISSAARGPHSPARYGVRLAAGPELLQRVDHLPGRSTSSLRGNSVASPMQHVEEQPLVGLRADDSVNASPYRKSIDDVADLHRRCPAPWSRTCSVTPSSGCTRMTSWLWPSSSVSVAANGRCGAFLKTTAISVTRRGSRLPVRR